MHFQENSAWLSLVAFLAASSLLFAVTNILNLVQA